MAPMEHNRLLSGNVAWPEIILVCITMALAISHPAQGAPNVGVASAVLLAAQSARPYEAAKILRIGVDIVENERVTN